MNYKEFENLANDCNLKFEDQYSDFLDGFKYEYDSSLTFEENLKNMNYDEESCGFNEEVAKKINSENLDDLTILEGCAEICDCAADGTSLGGYDRWMCKMMLGNEIVAWFIDED